MRRAPVRGRKVHLVACAAGLAAAVAAATGLAANGPRNPLVLVLRPADFPAKADPVDSGPMPASFARKLRNIRAVGRAAQYFANIPFGPERAQTVFGLVVTTPSVAEAKKVFAWQKRTEMRPAGGASPLRLPRYGDEQVALSSSETDSGSLLVRQAATVWRLDVAADGELALPPARVRDELVKYAAKQRGKLR
ncbi:MAG TPA: hypothetical protein VGF10_12790 [Gaiella sp.]